MSFSSDASRSGAGGNVVRFPGPTNTADKGWRKIGRQIWQGGRFGFKRHGLTMGVVVLVIASISLGLWSFSAAGLPRYITVPAARGSLARAVKVTGTINPAQTIVISAAVSGIVHDLSCADDSQVKAGQVCAKIDPRPYQAVLDQYSAQLLRDQAILEKDRADLVHLRRHVAANAAANPLVRPQLAEQALIVSRDEGTVKLDQALVESAKLNLSYTDIVAPADGTVTARNVSEGEPVTANASALFVIAADPERMEIDADPAQRDIGAIHRGDAATITVAGLRNRTFHGTVSHLRRSPPSGQTAASFSPVVAVDNADLALKPGMIASMQIIVEQRSDVLRVPDQALQFTPPAANAQTAAMAEKDEPQIWVLRGNAPVAVNVTTGLSDGQFTEITQGELKPGDQVIVGENRPQAQAALSGAP